MQTKSRTLILLALCWALIPASAGAVDPTRSGEVPEDYLYSFQPLPEVFESATNPITEAKITLGRTLFYDHRLSKNHDLACNGCHELASFGVDNRRLSPGHRNQKGTRNSPTVYNAAIHVSQFWDGRSPDVEDQSKHPILDPVEMAMPDEQRVVATLRSMPGYLALFKQAFPGEPDPVTYDNMALAIGAFERRLVTPGAFDRFLQGDPKALTEPQKQGFMIFVELGCASCHNGPGLGGHTHELLGLIEPYPDQSDLGIYELTEAEEDKMRFKVPGLRNIAKTAPYFHDGSIGELEEAVSLMATHQLGVAAGEADVAAILAFLDSLTGELPASYIAKPVLPEKSDTTPEPIPD